MHDASPPPVCMSGWLRAGQLEARHDGVDCLAVTKAMKKYSDEELERQRSPRRPGASRECGEVVTRVEASPFWVIYICVCETSLLSSFAIIFRHDCRRDVSVLSEVF